MKQLELLWHLQEVDRRLTELEKMQEESPVLSEANRWEQQVEGGRKNKEEIQKNLEEKRKEMRKKEMQLQKLAEESSSLRKKMYGGEVSSTRELEQMEKRLKKIEQEKEELEGKIIEEMEEIETAEEEKSQQENQLQEEIKTLEEKKQLWHNECQRIKEEKENLLQQRNELEGKVENQLLEKYRVFFERYQGKGLARVTSDICGGCRMFVSAAIKGRLYNLNSIVYCENCGRILVKFPEQD